jgi:[protein-PII] uridylyltransferase
LWHELPDQIGNVSPVTGTSDKTRAGRKKGAAAKFVDGTALRVALTALHDEHGGNATALRAAVLARLREAIEAGRGAIEAKFMEDGRGTVCARRLSELQDEIIQVTYDFAVTHVYRAQNPSAAERISIVAVGGYGRGTLAPGSDIDLLFLLPYKQTAWGESVVEYVLYTLWDLGFKVGHATRSVTECIRLSKADATIQTAVLEARYIWGDRALFDELWQAYEKNIMAGGPEDFIATKLVERDQRHRRAGESRYLVEPDVKDGKGGLRDLHTLFWIAKFCYRTRSVADLVKAGLFTRKEYLRFRRCDDFLWSVRCHLHFLAGRAEERLSFDLQPELANRLGYAARGGLKHVERFMKHYFLVAKDVGDLTRIFCAALEAREMVKPPVISRFLSRLRGGRTSKLGTSEDFHLVAGRINVTSDDVFARDPVNLIRLFHLAGKHNVSIHPYALQLVTRSLKFIDRAVRNDPEANALFLEILTSRDAAEELLRRMNEAGVLGRFIPDFGRIVSLMQFNMYHHYTVDEHLLRAVGILAEIERGELAEQHPLANEIIHTVENRRALYVAMLLHDIAKGRKENHSAAGERVARNLCPRLGLTAAETEMVAWLVRHHLIMSDYAQTRDLNDYKTILDFAAEVQGLERLKQLLILTVADIKAVGPGVWNGWKGQLLRTLYYETVPILSGGHVSVSRAARLAAAQHLFRATMSGWTEAQVEAYLGRHYAPYWLSVDLKHQVLHARLIERAEREGRPVVTDVSSDAFTAITELTIIAPDHPRLLAILTGACAAAGANIVGAHISTTADGMALDTIHVQRQFKEARDEERRGLRIAETIEAGLRGEVRMRDLVETEARPPKRLRAFTVEPVVMIDNESSNLFTVIEVNGLDRPGLLFKLTSALSELNLNIGSAHIATFGERVVDVFYVTDLTGAKIINKNRQNAIRRRLLTALQGADAAVDAAAE